MFTAIVFVLTIGCAWRMLPRSFGVAVPTAHRRFADWTKAGLWTRIHHAVLDRLGEQGLVDWSRLTTRWERHARHYLAFATLATALTCCKKLPT
ncbi:Putative transposase of IS4/5 family [Actinokineospora terrae]|uniref:Putative transposase of IS4/5 family n=1 Tax=Actinokineospora terrae TaxID=155974 RepID=A0A1H9MBS4_9PSEU|nr:Putative transposase of IS4/5 family [Actinokineospora terrae]